jgi:signal transduction histidine kinase
VTPARIVLVGEQFSDLTHSRQVLLRSLLVGYPLLLLLFGVIAWQMTGWTLRPVEALRAGAEQISGSGRDDHLPVPGTHDEIRALAETLNAMLDRLESARARQRAFVADAAHELRSPLTSMRTQIEVAQHLGEGGPLEAGLLAELVRLSNLVDGLLVLARSDAGAPPSGEPHVLPVADLLATVAVRHRKSRVPVTVRTAPATLAVEVVEPEAVRIVANLVDNAVRHAATRVELSATDEDGFALLAVDDDGPGIPDADLERVFDRFTRLDAARDRDSGGSGLGLAIVRELTRRAGGTVRLTRSTLGGLRAEVRLPVVDEGHGQGG